jgi:hypothetical protein
MPFDFNAFILLAAAILTAVIVAAIFLFAWLGRRVRARNLAAFLAEAEAEERAYDAMGRAGGFYIAPGDELSDTDIDELMRHAAGDDPEVRITRPDGER